MARGGRVVEGEVGLNIGSHYNCVNLFHRRVGKIRITYYVDFGKRKVVVVKVDFRGKAYKGL